MTIETENRKAGPYLSDGVQLIFPFNFRIFSKTDIVVTVGNDDIGNPNNTILSVDIDYDVSFVDGGDDGNVVLKSPQPVGIVLVITSDVPKLQPLHLTNKGGMFPEVLEQAFDRCVVLTQQLNEKVSRAVTLPVTIVDAPEDYLDSFNQIINEKTAAAVASAASASSSAGNASSSETAANDAASRAEEAAAAVIASLPDAGNPGDVLQLDDAGKPAWGALDLPEIPEAFPSGTQMLFIQAAAPTGWTKVTDHDDKALRIVSGEGGGTGGDLAFSSAFDSRTIDAAIGDTTLTIAQIPAHSHSVNTGHYDENGGSQNFISRVARGVITLTGSVTATGSSQPHTHSATVSAFNLAVQYVDAIIARKD